VTFKANLCRQRSNQKEPFIRKMALSCTTWTSQRFFSFASTIISDNSYCANL
jgi:hypothetical protein